MSVELANASKIIDQVASNQGYSDLIAAADGDYGDGLGAIVLRTFFERGYTTAVDSCIKTLKNLAAADGTSADVAKTAKGLAALMDGETFVILTHGTSESITESLREAGKHKTLKRVLTVAAFMGFDARGKPIHPTPIMVGDDLYLARPEDPGAGTVSRASSGRLYSTALESLVAGKIGEMACALFEKRWVTEPDACDDCMMNADAGWIPADEDFPSGDEEPPLIHPRCRCMLDIRRTEEE